MLGDILHFHRTEGAKADMQGYMGDLYTGILYLLQKLFCKVQSCGRSGCASLVFRATQDTTMLRLASNTGLSPSMVSLSRLFFSQDFLQRRGPTTPHMP